MGKELRFELNLGSLCNFRCSYCFENGDCRDYKPTQVSGEYLYKYADLITYLKSQDYHRESCFTSHVYGGEPLLQINKVEDFIKRTKNSIFEHNIITNGYLVDKYQLQLRRLRFFHPNISIHVSFDYILQDEMRQRNSYDIVRKNIKWLYDNKLCRRTITTFSAKNFHRIHEVFFDFISLRKELPNLAASFNIDRFGSIPTDLDESPIRQSLEKIKEYLDEHPEDKGAMAYNVSAGWIRASKPVEGCYFQNVYVAMCEDGSIYPGYECLYETEIVKKLSYIGHITEGFDTIVKKRQDFLDSLPKQPKQDCINCTAHCRVFPWRVLKTDLNEWWDIPEGGHCKIHKLISEYL